MKKVYLKEPAERRWAGASHGKKTTGNKGQSKAGVGGTGAAWPKPTPVGAKKRPQRSPHLADVEMETQGSLGTFCTCREAELCREDWRLHRCSLGYELQEQEDLHWTTRVDR